MKKFFLRLFCVLFALLLSAACGCMGEAPDAPAESTPPALDTHSPQPEIVGGTFTLRSLNLGEADAHLLLLPDGSAALIDTGRKKQFDQLDAALSASGVTKLSALILTHGHKDHVGGFAKLTEKYPVERIYTAFLSKNTFSDKNLERIADSGMEHVQLSAGDTFELCGVTFRVLAPRTATEDENNLSLVILAQYGNTRFLLMGDAKEEVEAELLSLGLDLSADVLKTGHHGKDDATTSEFLAAVSPEYAILTGCEEDEEGDSPGVQTMARLEAEGIPMYIMRKDYLAADFVSNGNAVEAVIITEW